MPFIIAIVLIAIAIFFVGRHRGWWGPNKQG